MPREARRAGAAASMSALADVGIVLRRETVGEHRAACPHCAAEKPRRGDDALAVKIEPQGSATWICHRCGWKGAATACGSACATAWSEHRPVQPQRVGSMEDALAIYRAARAIAPGTVAACYLEARGCSLPHPDGHLRFLEQHRHPSGHIGPALIALVTGALAGEPRTVRRTWFQADGKKAAVHKPRLLWPGLPKMGGLVRLWPDDAVSLGLCAGEGIETALTAARGFGLAWATLDAGNLADLPVLAGIEALTIAVDNDPAGIGAARSCAARWHARGVEVSFWTAPQAGADLNDHAAAAS